jgi:hypothetical protein
LEKYRYINVEYDKWWDCVESDFMEDMSKVGVYVSVINFSGFSSQGDGACFNGQLDNALVYLDHHHKDQYPMIRKLLENGGSLYISCKHKGNYYHENSADIWIDHDLLFAVIDQPTEFHVAVVEEWDKLLDVEMTDFDTNLTEQWKTYMRDLYRRLEAEYEYLTSDEGVWDTIVANELDKDAENLDQAA